MDQIDWVRSLVQQVWDIGRTLEPIEWVAVLLAILVVQATLLLRSARRRPGTAVAQQFDEITTRLNMVIFELRQIRGAYGNESEDDGEQADLAEEYTPAAE